MTFKLNRTVFKSSLSHRLLRKMCPRYLKEVTHFNKLSFKAKGGNECDTILLVTRGFKNHTALL